MIVKRHTALSVIVILTGLALITTSAIVTPAFAIKRFFNCMTDTANKHGKLDIADVNNCYYKEYPEYATHSRSQSGTSSSSSTGSGSSSFGSASGSNHH